MLELVLFANVIDLQTLTVWFEPFISTSQKSMSECYVTKVYRLSTLKRGKLFPETRQARDGLGLAEWYFPAAGRPPV